MRGWTDPATESVFAIGGLAPAMEVCPRQRCLRESDNVVMMEIKRVSGYSVIVTVHAEVEISQITTVVDNVVLAEASGFRLSSGGIHPVLLTGAKLV